MPKNTKLAVLLAGLALSACTCEPDKPPLPEARVDSGFTFDDDAFSFPNFGGRGHGAALNPALVERMHGKTDVCEPSSAECRLTPLAKEYMRSVNDAMQGGRCEGFAVLSALMSSGAVDVTEYGANRARDLELDSNRALGGEIAYWFATQYLGDVVQGSTQPLSGEDAVRFLAEAYADGGAMPFRIGIARLDEAGYLTGGHAILATAVGPGDDEGTYFIYVYDNNLPDAEKKIVVDLAAGTWEYIASTNPDDPAALYRGTPDNGNVLFVAALPPREGVHPCAFCDSDAELQQVFGSAGAVVTVEDDDGARTGEVEGRIVDEVDGSRTVPLVSANNSDRAGTITVLPQQGVTMSVTQGQAGAPASVRMFAPNLMIAAENLTFGDDGESKTVLQTNADGTEVTLSPGDGGGGSSLTVGSQAEDGTQTITEATIPPGESVDGLGITTGEDGNPSIEVEGEGSTSVGIEVSRNGPDGEDSYSGTVEVPGGGSATLLVDDWSENGGELGAEVDEDGDGEPDQTVVVDETEPLVPPATPTGLVATAQGSNQIALSWTDAATDELAYEVERDDGNGFARIAILAADSVAFVDTGLTAATAYSYRVRATAAGVASEYSTVATATTGPDELFSIGGTVSGLRGFVVLQNRGTGETINVDANGAFTFANEQRAGETFDVAVAQRPRGQRCDVAAGLGVVRADVTTVVVTCVDVFFVGVAVSGLQSGGLILENNGVDVLPVDDNGLFTFTTPVAVGDAYAVAVRRQAPGHECVVEAGNGVVDGPVPDVVVLCAPIDLPTFTVSVSVTGLGTPPATGLVLQNNGGDDLAIVEDGVSAFATPVTIGDPYSVTVLQQPAGLQCFVLGGEGAGDVDVVVDVICELTAPLFTVSVSVTGLGTPPVTGLVLQNNGGDDLPIASEGVSTFATPLVLGSGYAVTVSQQPAGAVCAVANGAGSGSGPVLVDVICERQFVVGGSATGLKPGNVVTLLLEDRVPVEVTGDGAFFFPGFFPAGTLVSSVSVFSQPPDQICFLDAPTGLVTDADVLDVALTCIETFTVGGTVNAPSFAQLVISNRAGSDVAVVAPGVTTFAFPRRFASGEGYDVAAVGDAVTCEVLNATGTVGRDVNDITVNCTLVPIDFALTNPSPQPDVLPADVDLGGVEFDIALPQPFPAFYGTPARAEVRDGNGALVASGTWALRDAGQQLARITFSPSVTLGAPRAEALQGNPSGSLFADDCPAGQVPIGFHAELGASVDGLSVVCGGLQLDPNTLAVTVVPGATLPPRGGTNTTQAEPRCPANTVLVAFSGNSGAFIDRIDMQCAALTVTGTAPNLTVTVGTPVAGDGFGGNGGGPFAPTSCAADEIATGLTVQGDSNINALGLRCSAIGPASPVSLAAGNHEVSLLSNFSLNGEPAADRVFARASQPLRALPRGLTAVAPPTIFEGDTTILSGQGVAVFGDAIVMFRQGIPEALFRGVLNPASCTGRTQAGCILQQAPFTAEFEFPGVYDVCVAPGVNPNDFGTLPSSCPPGSPTLTILTRPGTPDLTYSSTPLVRVPNVFESASAVGFDANGNQYVAGISSGEAMVAKLFSDGTPDTSYGTVGFALAGLTTAAAAPGCFDVAADGTVTIATALTGTDGNSNPAEIYVVRFTPGGGVDGTYGSGVGTFINDGNTFAEQYLVQGCKKMSDGRLVIGASFFSTGAVTRFQSVWRIDVDGTFSDSNVLNDPSFTNEDGQMLVPGPGDTAVIVGRLDNSAGFLRVDNSIGMFASNGWTAVALDASPTAVSAFSDAFVLGDGAFVAVGASLDNAVETPRVVQVGADDVAGTPVAFTSGTGAQGPYKIAQEPSGRFVVVGGSSPSGPPLVRLESTLANDATWGTNGVVAIPELTSAADVQVDAFGRAVVGGSVNLDNDFNGSVDGSAMRVLRFVSGL